MQDAVININGNSIQTLELIFLMTSISLLPFVLLMMTCFTRIIIVLSFARSALGVQATPPNTVLIGIALFETCKYILKILVLDCHLFTLF